MDKISNNFCSSCDSDYSVIFSVKKGELYDMPLYCPFCSEAIDNTEDEDSEED